MYFVVGLQGHFESSCPSSSGAPTVCKHLTKSLCGPSTSRTFVPTRVMMCMLTTTYSESVISMPMWEIDEPSGPMQKGITYMVRPRIEPSSRRFMVAFMSLGSTQLFVGPASSLRRLHIKVRSSTLATSLGSEKQAKLLGLF